MYQSRMHKYDLAVHQPLQIRKEQYSTPPPSAFHPSLSNMLFLFSLTRPHSFFCRLLRTIQALDDAAEQNATVILARSIDAMTINAE
eukprot:3932043-Rhodomonas_salina.5